MINHFTRIVIPIFFGITFGFFIGCSTTSPDNGLNRDEGLSQKQIEQRLNAIDEEIDKNPSNPDLLYEKGVLLGKLANKYEHPSDRTAIYSNLRQNLTKAYKSFGNAGNQSRQNEVDELLNVTWSNEHNSGIKLIQEDTSTTSSEIKRAVEHFNNATVILPDSAISYEMQARAYYKLKQQDEAIRTLERARKNIDPLPASLMEQLAYLYMENGDTQQAVEIYEQAQSLSDQNLNLIHGLANAYIAENKHQEAVELLELLVDNKPESIIYGQSLATELYYLAAEKIDSAISEHKKDTTSEIRLFNEIDPLLSKAETQFKESLDVNSDNYELERSFAYFYQNSASKYQKLLPYLSNEEADYVKDKIQTYLRSSIPLFLKLAEQNPQESNFLKNLYQVYSYLGMEEKAKETKAKLN